MIVLAGVAFTLSLAVFFFLMVSLVLDTVRVGFFTVILHVEDAFPTVAVMVAFPTPFAVIFPYLSTIATFLLLVLNTGFLVVPVIL